MEKLQKSSNLDLVADCYSLYHDELILYVTARLHDAIEAEDIVQDVFVKLLEIDTPIVPGTLRQLAYKMAFNRLVDYWRRSKYEQEYEKILSKKLLNGGKFDVESIYAVKEVNDFLERGMALLCPNDRKLYRLNVCDGMRVGEIAQELQFNYKYVENHLGSARKVVRKYMKRMLA